ncbi:MAG: hypothetical protein FWE05_11930 [Defluviitaleaceae bacterium]|nr:hypothetical protein [Defluviitaleaceae bacterium]
MSDINSTHALIKAEFTSKYVIAFKKASDFLKKYSGIHTDEHWNALSGEMNIFVSSLEVRLGVAVIHELERMHVKGSAKDINRDELEIFYNAMYKPIFEKAYKMALKTYAKVYFTSKENKLNVLESEIGVNASVDFPKKLATELISGFLKTLKIEIEESLNAAKQSA